MAGHAREAGIRNGFLNGSEQAAVPLIKNNVHGFQVNCFAQPDYTIRFVRRLADVYAEHV